MKDLTRMFIYGGLSVATILILVYMANTEMLSSGAIGFIAIFLVVVLPIIIAVRISSKERDQS
jgi:hypothetical protein